MFAVEIHLNYLFASDNCVSLTEKQALTRRFTVLLVIDDYVEHCLNFSLKYLLKAICVRYLSLVFVFYVWCIIRLMSSLVGHLLS